jgi:hypothetical protein
MMRRVARDEIDGVNDDASPSWIPQLYFRHRAASVDPLEIWRGRRGLPYPARQAKPLFVRRARRSLTVGEQTGLTQWRSWRMMRRVARDEIDGVNDDASPSWIPHRRYKSFVIK